MGRSSIGGEASPKRASIRRALRLVRATRRRLWWIEGLDAFALVGALVLILSLVVGFSGPVPWNIPTTYLVLLLLLAAIAAAVLVGYIRLPRERAIIRRVDTALGLHTSLVTCLELAAHPPSNSQTWRFYDAMLLWLEPRLESARASDIVRFRPKVTQALGLCCFLSAMWIMGSDVSFTDLKDRRSGIQTYNVEQLAPLSAELERLAESLDTEANDLDSSYAVALSAAARELSQRLQQPDVSFDGAVLESEVRRLMDHIALGTRIGGAANSLASDTTVQGTSGTFGSMPEDLLDSEQILRADASPQVEELLTGAVQGLRERIEARRRLRWDPYGSGSPIANDSAPDSGENSASAGFDAEGIAGNPVGPAERSNQGAGDASGRGTMDLGETFLEDLAFVEGNDFVLPAAAADSGARVGVEGVAPAHGLDSNEWVSDGGGEASLWDGEGAPGIIRGGAEGVRTESGGWRSSNLAPRAIEVARTLWDPRGATK